MTSRSLVGEAVAGVILELIRLHLFAVLAALVGMPRLVAVGQHHVLADLLRRKFAGGAAAVVLAARAGTDAFLAGVSHGRLRYCFCSAGPCRCGLGPPCPRPLGLL